MGDWWHMYGDAIATDDEPVIDPPTAWMSCVLGSAEVGPDDAWASGRKVRKPLEVAGHFELSYRGSWDHEPDRFEKAEATPLLWHEDDCDCGAIHPDEYQRFIDGARRMINDPDPRWEEVGELFLAVADLQYSHGRPLTEESCRAMWKFLISSPTLSAAKPVPDYVVTERGNLIDNPARIRVVSPGATTERVKVVEKQMGDYVYSEVTITDGEG